MRPAVRGSWCRRAWLPRVAAVAVVPVLGLPQALRGQVDSVQIERFAQRVLVAFATRDTAAYRSLLHPEVQRCLGADAPPYLDAAIDMRVPLFATSLRLERWTMVPAGRGAPPAVGSLAEQVRHQMDLHYRFAETGSGSIRVEAVQDAGGWRAVLACPSRGEVAAAAARLAERRAFRERVRQRADSLPAAWRRELLLLIGAGRQVDAALRYRELSGSDLREAAAIVDYLWLRPDGERRLEGYPGL